MGGRIVVSLPAHLSGEAREKTIAWLVDRLVAKHPLRTAIGDSDLMARAEALSDRYRIGARPTSVRWVTNQMARWGSCSLPLPGNPDLAPSAIGARVGSRRRARP